MGNASASEYRCFNPQLQIGSGIKSSANGEFEFPHSIIFDRHHLHSSENECIVVSDPLNNRLQWFDRFTLRHLTSYGKPDRCIKLGQFNGPTGLCLQPITNRLVVCDSWNHRVQVFSLDDDIVPLPLFAIGRKPISNLSGSIQPSRKKGEFIYPQGVCCSPNGDIYVNDTCNHRVQSFDAGGRFLSTFGSQGAGDQMFSHPQTVCFVHPHFSPSSVASSLICVADEDSSRISVWSSNNNGPSSSSFSSLSQHLFNFQVEASPQGLCVDLKGYLHVSCCIHSNVVQIYDFRMVKSTNSCTVSSDQSNDKRNPALVQTLGKDGVQGEKGSGPGEFYEPTGMCVDNENVLMVVDCNNHRVQFFDECQC